jgi:hypothetical protein
VSRYSRDELLDFEQDFADPPLAEQADDQAERAPHETLGNGRGARTSSSSAGAQLRALAPLTAGAHRHDSALARQERAVRAALHDRAGTGRPSRAAVDERRVRDELYGARGRVAAAPIRPPVAEWPEDFEAALDALSRAALAPAPPREAR